MNSELIENFVILRDYYKQTGDQWRFKSYKNAVTSLGKVPYRITSVDQVKDIRGIGKKIQAKVDEYLKTGKIKAAEEVKPKLKKKTSSEEYKSIKLFIGIWGVGEETAKKLYAAGMRNLQDLRDNTYLLTENQKIGLKYYSDLQERISRQNITVFQVAVRVLLNQAFGKGTYKLEPAGSYRRGAPSSGDVDIFMTSAKFALVQVVNLLQYHGLIADVLSMKGVKFMGIGNMGPCGLQPTFFHLDIVFMPAESWVSGLFAWTGDKNLNIKLRTKATKLGYTLSDYSLYNHETGKPVPLRDDRDIFAALGEKYLKPTERNL